MYNKKRKHSDALYFPGLPKVIELLPLVPPGHKQHMKILSNNMVFKVNEIHTSYSFCTSSHQLSPEFPVDSSPASQRTVNKRRTQTQNKTVIYVFLKKYAVL